MIAGLLSAGRAQAESLMTDACTITRAGAGEPVFDPETGGYTDPPAVTVYEGKCRVQMRGAAAVQNAQLGGEDVTFYDVEVSLPITVTDVEVGDLVTMTAAAFDDGLAGTSYRVHGLHAKSQATARRLLCERAAEPSSG